MYSLSFLISYLLLIHGEKFLKSGFTKTQKENILILTILGVILGGRLGYILFYNLQYYLLNPHKLLAVWEGGMSFHGGLTTIIILNLIYAKTTQLKFLRISDLIVQIAPIGIFLGRLGNFINGEIYGRISPDGQFCLNFPTDPSNCRYPSQLYEAIFEGLFLFILINLLNQNKTSSHGNLSAIFLIGYGTIRFTIEFLREPDLQIGLIANYFTMGQLLCLPLIILGTILYLKTKQPKSS